MEKKRMECMFRFLSKAKTIWYFMLIIIIEMNSYRQMTVTFRQYKTAWLSGYQIVVTEY